MTEELEIHRFRSQESISSPCGKSDEDLCSQLNLKVSALKLRLPASTMWYFHHVVPWYQSTPTKHRLSYGYLTQIFPARQKLRAGLTAEDSTDTENWNWLQWGGSSSLLFPGILFDV